MKGYCPDSMNPLRCISFKRNAELQGDIAGNKGSKVQVQVQVLVLELNCTGRDEKKNGYNFNKNKNKFMIYKNTKSHTELFNAATAEFKFKKEAPKKWYSDKMGSTYWWRCFFIPGNRLNANGAEKYDMLGYSKDSRHNEPVDPGQCFCDKVEMLATNNGRQPNGEPYPNTYFKDSEKIEFHIKRVGEFPNKATDPLFITLYPERYEIPQDNVASFDDSIRIFLNNFYKGLKGQMPPVHMIPTKLRTMDSLLLHNCNTWEEVMQHTQKIKNAGHPSGVINGYFTKQMDRLHQKGKV
jgi:hypothetical protein